MALRTASLVFTALLIGPGCQSAKVIDTTTSKGVESPLPEDNKDDSFRQPTMHGELAFGLAGQADLTDDEQYHAWTFELSDEAEVTLFTELVTPNVDTVLYLYRWSDEAAKWGGYKYRNDDHEKGVLWSRLDKTLKPGKYRALVKAFKLSIRGQFRLHGECTGPGCPSVDAPDAPAVLPAETPFTPACIQAIDDALLSDVVSSDTRQAVYETDRDALPARARIGADLYKSYFDHAWEDTVEEETGQHHLELHTLVLEEGALVTVTFEFADEATVTFLLDGDDQPLALYHDEQSPTAAFFCVPDDGVVEDTAEIPDEWCAGAWLRNTPHTTADEVVADEEVAVSAVDQLPAMTAHAAGHYAQIHGLDADAALEVTTTGWESADWGAGAIVVVEHEDHPATSYLGTDTHFGETRLVHATTDGQTAMICDESF